MRFSLYLSVRLFQITIEYKYILGRLNLQMSWRGVLNTTVCEKFVSDLREVGGFLWVLRFLHQ
jgi:hypothetical protein